MKKLLSFLFLICTFLSLTLTPIFAKAPYVVDKCGYLTAEQLQALNARAEEIAEKYNVGLYVRIMPDKEGKSNIREYAEYLYKKDEMGLGAEQNGYLLTICMDDRSYLTSAYGNKAHAAFTDYGKDQVEDYVEGELRHNDFNAAIKVFLIQAEYMLQQNELGTPVDVPGVKPMTEEELRAQQLAQRRRLYAVAGTTSPLASLLICLGLKRRNRTKGIKVDADSYIPKNGIHLTNVKDIFLYKTQSRTLIVDTSSKSGGGGTTINAGGFSHGSGGHF